MASFKSNKKVITFFAIIISMFFFPGQSVQSQSQVVLPDIEIVNLKYVGTDTVIKTVDDINFEYLITNYTEAAVNQDFDIEIYYNDQLISIITNNFNNYSEKKEESNWILAYLLGDRTFTRPGRNTFDFIVDPQNMIPESNENNNKTSITVDVIASDDYTGFFPDLSISNLKLGDIVDAYLGGPIVFDYTITNHGDFDIDKYYTMSYYIDNEIVFGGMMFADSYKLKKGESSDESIILPTVFLKSGKVNISVEIDSGHIIDEINENNNIVSVEAEIMTEAGDRPDIELKIADGTLVRSEFDNKVYVIKDGKKLWIESAEQFSQAGYSWDEVYPVRQEVLDIHEDFVDSSAGLLQHIAEGAVIKSFNNPDIYIVKYVGIKKFKRLILSPSVFENYGHLNWNDVLEVDQTTLDSFQTSNLVRSVITGRIYSLEPQGDTGEKRFINNLNKVSLLGFDVDSIYDINEFDENSYKAGIDL